MKKILQKLLVFLFWIGIWECVSLIVASPLLLPGPYQTFLCLIKMAATYSFWESVLFSFGRILIGLLVGILLGFSLALGASFVPLIDAVFSPLMRVIRATPVASFIILVWLLIGRERVPAMIVVLMVSPILYENILRGFRETGKQYLEVAKVYRFGTLKTLRYVYFPSALPYITTAVHTSIGLGWKSGIAAEIICYPVRSIGAKIFNANLYLETPELFAWTATVILFSMVLETLAKLVAGRRKRA